jgi:hypothetical protein
MSTSEDGSSSSSWATTIQSVRTPIGLFALAFLIIAASVPIIAASVQEPAKTWLLGGLFVLLFILLAIVVILAFVRPEALHGQRPEIAIAPEKTRTSSPEAVHDVARESGIQPELVDPTLIPFIPPLSAARFKTIELPRHEPPKFYQYPYAPTGLVVIYDIPFSLLPVHDAAGNPMGHLAVNLQPTPQNKPDSEVIPVDASNVCAVHFLIAAGHGWPQRGGVTLLYRRIGYIRMRFSDGGEQTVNLVLGRNIREWAFGNDPKLVTEIDTSQAKPAWLSHDSRRRIDLLSAQIEHGPKHINRIEIVAEFGEDHPDREVVLPAILVSAITLERQA